MSDKMSNEPQDYPSDEMLMEWAAEYCEETEEPIYAIVIRKRERELNKAIVERDEARECLREAVSHADSFPEAYPIEQVERWRKAAGIEDGK